MNQAMLDSLATPIVGAILEALKPRDRQIAELKKQVAELTQQNAELTQQNGDLRADLDSLSASTAHLAKGHARTQSRLDGLRHRVDRDIAR